MADDNTEMPNITGPTERDVEERVKDFSELLKSIESIDDKKRQLWKEIYENAIVDRQNSYAMFTILARIAANKTAEHAVHAKSIATYIAGMAKANDQLIKLAELIAKTQIPDEIDPDSIFDKIKGS